MPGAVEGGGNHCPPTELSSLGCDGAAVAAGGGEEPFALSLLDSSCDSCLRKKRKCSGEVPCGGSPRASMWCTCSETLPQGTAAVVKPFEPSFSLLGCDSYLRTKRKYRGEIPCIGGRQGGVQCICSAKRKLPQGAASVAKPLSAQQPQDKEERAEKVIGSVMSVRTTKSDQKGDGEYGTDPSSHHQTTIRRTPETELQQLRGCHGFANPLDQQPEVPTAGHGSVVCDTPLENESAGVMVDESITDNPDEFEAGGVPSAGLEVADYGGGGCCGRLAPTKSASGSSTIDMRDQQATNGDGEGDRSNPEVGRWHGGLARSLADRLDTLPEFTPFGGMPIRERRTLAPVAVRQVNFVTVASGARFDADFMVPGRSRVAGALVTRTDGVSNRRFDSVTPPMLRKACDICTRRKTKCDGNTPCAFCKKHQKTCHRSALKQINGACRSFSSIRASQEEVSKRLEDSTKLSISAPWDLNAKKSTFGS